MRKVAIAAKPIKRAKKPARRAARGKPAKAAVKRPPKRLARRSARKSAVDRDNPPLTEAELRGMRRVTDAKRIRWNLGLSQEDFARAYQIPIGTLRDWEQYRSEPDAAGRTLLQLIEADPEGVRARIAALAQDQVAPAAQAAP